MHRRFCGVNKTEYKEMMEVGVDCYFGDQIEGPGVSSLGIDLSKDY